MAQPLTKAQKGALRALYDHGGEGVITRTGTLLAQGEELSDDQDGPQPTPYHSVTWLRLVAANLICGTATGEANRLRLTAAGVAEARR